jgi:23S rRNA G2445 N2-methylase RlmL/HEAT repeat protein
MPPRSPAAPGAPPAPPLAERVRDPGFTPSVRDLDALVDLLADEDLAKHVERAIGRIGAPAVAQLRVRLAAARPPLRGRIVKAIGRMAADPSAAGVLVELLEDADPKSRRNAAIALGRSRGDTAAGALMEAWKRDPRPEMRRTIAASLGKVGGEGALALLREAASAPDPELVRIAGRASIMVERTASRPSAAGLDPDRTAEQPVDVIVASRPGLEALLAEELAAAPGVERVQVEGSGRVRAVLAGPMSSLFAARTWLSFHFPVAGEGTRDGETVAQAVARALGGAAAQRVLGTWTAGAPRYRLEWVDAGHQRAATWEAVRAIAARSPGLVNDPTASTWEVRVTTRGGSVGVALAPRALVDPRFPWRKKDVPAASHPTVAAALARVAGAREGDVVWDPFVGSAGELIERARLGPCRTLFGSDVDPRALAAARENLAAAGLHATLEQADVLDFAPPGVTLVITNPPMGRRSSRAAGTGDMLDRFVAHAAAVLVPGGRLVWIAPWPKAARAAAEHAGLALEYARAIDMGGFDAEIQRWARSSAC